MKNLIKKHDQRGDTILEVVIAITLIAMLLSGALALTRANLLQVRRSQEHSEALQIAQSQLEYIRGYITSTNLPGVNSTFCISSSLQIIGSGSLPCNVDSLGNQTSTQPIYHIVDSPPSGSNPNTFTVSINWGDVSGRGQDNVTLYYKLYTRS